jgi:hypothetical protein
MKIKFLLNYYYLRLTRRYSSFTLLYKIKIKIKL